MRNLVLDAMGVVFINEDDVEELLIPFLGRRFDSFNVETLRDFYYNHVSLGKISSKAFFSNPQYSKCCRRLFRQMYTDRLEHL